MFCLSFLLRFVRLVVALWVTGVVCAFGESLRLLELRDGTRIGAEFAQGAVLVLQRKDIVSGELLDVRVRLEDVDRVSFSEEPAMEKLLVIQKALRSLESDDFPTREAGQSQLLAGGRGFRSILEQRLLAGSGAEVRWRLKHVLRLLPVEQLPEMRLPYDIVRTKDGQVFEGDFGDWSLEVRYRGETLVLSRRIVLGIRDERAAGSSQGRANARRIMLENYFPIFVFILVGVVFGIAPVITGMVLGPHRPDRPPTST